MHSTSSVPREIVILFECVHFDVAGYLEIFPVIWSLHVTFRGQLQLIVRSYCDLAVSSDSKYICSYLRRFYLPRTVGVLCQCRLWIESRIRSGVFHINEPFIATRLCWINL